VRDDGEILPPETAALIRAGLSPRERVEDVVALAVHIAARRARLREEAPDVDDVLFALGLWGWYPRWARTHPAVQAGLERLRLDLVHCAHDGIFEDADRLVPDPVLQYELANIEDLQRERDGHRRYLAIEAGPSFV
jgi:hypothetical protein